MANYGMQVMQRRADDPTWLNLLGVAMAEVEGELVRLRAINQRNMLRQHKVLSAERLWREAARMDAAFVSPVYNLARYYIHLGHTAHAIEALVRAKGRLLKYGPEGMTRRTLLYPIWSAYPSGSDRTLTALYNAAFFEYPDEAARAQRRTQLLLYRIEEVLGDLTAQRGDVSRALHQYRQAAETCPDAATTALRKALNLVESQGDETTELDLLEKLVAINPMDLPHRERLDALYTARGKVDATLREEIRLLTRAVPRRIAFEYPPLEPL
jgi:tetratricopeptide (TPR) repeat protein